MGVTSKSYFMYPIQLNHSSWSLPNLNMFKMIEEDFDS